MMRAPRIQLCCCTGSVTFRISDLNRSVHALFHAFPKRFALDLRRAHRLSVARSPLFLRDCVLRPDPPVRTSRFVAYPSATPPESTGGSRVQRLSTRTCCALLL